MRGARATGGLLATLVVIGCTPSDARFGQVRTTLADRLDQEVRWEGAAGGEQAGDRVDALLREPLSPDGAVQVALLNNRELQASLDVLDIRTAELLGATLLPNPHAEGAVRFGHEGERDLHGSLTISLSDLLWLPLRRSVASSRLDAATFEAADRVLDVAYGTRVAFYEHLADQQLLALARAVLEASFLAWDASKRLYEAGNTNELDVAQNRALYEEARLLVAEQELAVMDRREELQVWMGLWGPQTGWRAIAELPAPPDEELRFEDVESRAIERSLALASLRASFEAEAGSVDLGRARGALPELRAGVEAEREDGEWEVGPRVELEIPLFAQGQDAVGVAEARMRRLRHEYGARAVRIRSNARAARFRVQVARQRATFHRERLLPLRHRITELTLHHYNGMFASLFQVLEAKRREIEASRDWVRSVRDYWIARATLEHVLAGGEADARATRSRADAREVEGGMGEGGGH